MLWLFVRKRGRRVQEAGSKEQRVGSSRCSLTIQYIELVSNDSEWSRSRLIDDRLHAYVGERRRRQAIIWVIGMLS